MFKRTISTLVLVFAAAASTTAYCASEVFAYGETLEKAQDAAIKVAEKSAASKDTCVGGISTCKKQDDGLFRCGAYVADHKGSCNKDGSDVGKALDLLKKL